MAGAGDGLLALAAGPEARALADRAPRALDARATVVAARAPVGQRRLARRPFVFSFVRAH